MNTTIEYEVAVIILSFIGTILAAIYTARVSKAYRIWHDERAAVSLAKGIGLLVMSVGLLLSAVALVLESPTLAIAGLSLARGAFIVLIVTLVLADVRPRGREG